MHIYEIFLQRSFKLNYAITDFIHEVKNRVNIQEIAEYYGYTPNRQHKICCPFHSEKTPSLQIDEKKNMFYCFGCQTGGDSIKFIEKLYDLTPYRAAQKINQDMSLGLKAPTSQNAAPAPEPKERPLTEHEKKLIIDKWAFQQHDILLDYFRLLKEYSQELPKDNEINWKFAAFLDDFETVEFLLDRLLDKKTRYSMYANWQPTIQRITNNFKENIKREVKQNADKSNT